MRKICHAKSIAAMHVCSVVLSTHDVLDRQLRDGVVDAGQFLSHFLHEAVPILLRHPEVAVMHCNCALARLLQV